MAPDPIQAAVDADGAIPIDGRGAPGGMTRRRFIRSGTVGAAAVGLVGSVPGLTGLLTTASTQSQDMSGATAEGESALPDVAGPVIAHITDASAGELSIYVGEREVAFRDPVLVQRLLRAAR